MIQSVISDSVDKTRELGALFARNVDAPRVFALRGDLGCGKTEFVRGFVSKLNESEDIVSSPTFMLWNLYEINEITVNHLDLYRLSSIDDVLELGIIDVWETEDNYTFIEWAEKIEEILPKDVVNFFFKHIDENTREIQIETDSDVLIQTLKKFL